MCDDPAGDYVEDVLSTVERIPAGQVASYGDIAALVSRGGPRGVGRVMAQVGGAVCWWRVVRADGRPADPVATEALRRLRAENVPLRGDRVDLRVARWSPPVGEAESDRRPSR